MWGQHIGVLGGASWQYIHEAWSNCLQCVAEVWSRITKSAPQKYGTAQSLMMHQLWHDHQYFLFLQHSTYIHLNKIYSFFCCFHDTWWIEKKDLINTMFILLFTEAFSRWKVVREKKKKCKYICFVMGIKFSKHVPF